LAKRSLHKYDINQKIVWASVGIFAISGILPWFVVQFPIGNLKISIFDLIVYFTDSQGVEIDFYSAFIYEILLIGWIFAMIFLVVTAILKKNKLIFASSMLTIVSGTMWAFVVPHLRIQMIVLSLSNQPINADQTLGSGEITAIIAGCVLLFVYIRLKI